MQKTIIIMLTLSSYRNVVSVDVIGALLIIDRQQLDAGVVVRQDVGESVLATVARQLRMGRTLTSTYLLEVLLKTNVDMS